MKMLKKKKYIKRFTAVLASTILLTSVVQASSFTKKIDATFRNIKVFYNNQQQTVAQEPFLYNGSVYLPVRAVAQLVDKNVDWNGTTNSVFVSDKGGASSGDLEAQISAKNFEIAKLMGEKEVLEKKVKELEGNTNNSGGQSNSLKETQAYIEDEFDYKHSIDWEFKLSQTSSRINVEVLLDSRYDDKKWETLTKSQRETFFRDIAREIRFDHKDVTINGKLIDSRTDKTLATFDYTTSNKFTYKDNSSTSFTDLERDLEKIFKTVDGTKFPVDDIVLKGNEDDITFTVYIDLYNRTLQNQWEDALYDNKQDVRDFMRDISEEILRDYRYADVQGFIEDLEKGDTLVKFDGTRIY